MDSIHNGNNEPQVAEYNAGKKGTARKGRDLLRSLWLPLAGIAARRYVAGPALADALRVGRELSQQGYGVTISYWRPEGTTPRQIADSYHAALTLLPDAAQDWYLSIKAPDLYFSQALVSEVVSHGKHTGSRIHFDAHGPEVADQTFSLISAALQEYDNIGCTLPGRWRRSVADADLAVSMGLRIRVVKGQWREDPQQPDPDLRRGFLQVIDRLAGRARHVAVASHDPLVARAALSRLQTTGTPCELELLYGLPITAALRVAQEAGVPVRLYVPYGHGWLPYCLRQACKNPRIVWWMLRDTLSHRTLGPAGVLSET